MSGATRGGDKVLCPVCGGAAEAGCLYGASRGVSGLRWRAGDPGVWGNLLTAIGGGVPVGETSVFHGAFVRGTRCTACGHIVLEDPEGGDGPGQELVERASDLEHEGAWDEAAALYRRVLDDPAYRSHHTYARRSLDAIGQKRSASGEGA